MKLPVAIALLTLVVCVADFLIRLSPEEVEISGFKGEGFDNNIIVKHVDEKQRKLVEDALEQYDIVKVKTITKKAPKTSTAKKVQLMSDEEQAKQTGRLDQIYDGVNQYKLRAFFNNDGNKFAVIEKKNLQNNEIEKLSVKVGQSVSHYKITEISGTYTTFESGGRTIILQMFKNRATS